jgi:hypothetical protein
MLGRSRSYFESREGVLNTNESPPFCRTDFLSYTFIIIRFISLFRIICHLSTLAVQTQTLSDMTSQLRTVAIFVNFGLRFLWRFTRVEYHFFSFSDSQHLPPTNRRLTKLSLWHHAFVTHCTDTRPYKYLHIFQISGATDHLVPDSK